MNYKNKNWLKEKYLDCELSTFKIAKICGVGATTIDRYLSKFCITKRTISEALKIRFQDPKEKKKLRKAKLMNNPGAFKNREKNPNWNGGSYITKKGYVYVLKPNHPYSNNRGYVKRSRFVMEEHLGRYLKPEETVHHENEIKDDDKIENLSLFASGGKHISFHNLHRRIK